LVRKNILGSGFDLELTHRAGAYMCEETALIESLKEKRKSSYQSHHFLAV
jgi:NADH:ubiquinone oxidoreductase subunit F (NADH-binding)